MNTAYLQLIEAGEAAEALRNSAGELVGAESPAAVSRRQNGDMHARARERVAREGKEVNDEINRREEKSAAEWW